jgi:hypothetical protein
MVSGVGVMQKGDYYWRETNLLRCFVVGRSWVKISAWRPTYLTKIFYGFSQSLQANAGVKIKCKAVLLHAMEVLGREEV